MIHHPAENGIPQLPAGLAQLVPKGVKGVTLLGHVRLKPLVPESVFMMLVILSGSTGAPLCVNKNDRVSWGEVLKRAHANGPMRCADGARMGGFN